MDPEFKDYFSVVSSSYTRYRPTYPAELFDYLADAAPHRRLAWDCATGGGQAAVRLAARFEQVLATDASPEQIQHGLEHERVRYSVAPAHRSGIEGGSVDLVTVAQALHWLPFDSFYDEVRRVLKPGGVIAVWAYDLTRITPEIDRLVRHLAHDIIGDCWPPERVFVNEGFRTIPFPFTELSPPDFSMTATWNLDRFLGYLATWSAVSRYEERNGTDPIALIDADLRRAWGDPASPRRLTWPLYLRAGKL